MKPLKIHIKFKGRPLCGVKAQKRKLKFAAAGQPPTCGNCKRDAET